MKKWIVCTICGVTLLACSRNPQTDAERRRQTQEQADETARKAGHDAYVAAEKAEQAAKQLGRDIQSASDQAQKGWNDAKREQEQKQQDQH